MSKPTLFTPIQVGDLKLPNRIFMAPLTRNRATPAGVVGELNARYYRQRASGGLIISEMTVVSRQGSGYILIPGMFTDEQVAGWKTVTAAVHDQGGRIFSQLAHTGRVGHTSLNEGKPPVSASDIQLEGDTFTYDGPSTYSKPRALEIEEIEGIVQDFAAATVRAKEAGFDGVELHGANGYLIDQFTRSGSNKRTDQYGGSAENRARFALEVVRAAIDAWGESQCIGIRISPLNPFNGMADDNPMETYSYLVGELEKLNLAYLHVLAYDDELLAMIRKTFSGVLIVNGGFDREKGDAVLGNGSADAVSFGSTFLANPDLPIRFKLNAPLNAPNPATFYGGGAEGYTDYPTLSQL